MDSWNRYAKAFWCMNCTYCQSQIRYCYHCGGNLYPIYDDKEQTPNSATSEKKELQCTSIKKSKKRINVLECHRIVDPSHCPICGHRYHDNKVNVQLDSNEGDVYAMENSTSSSSCNLQLKVDISTHYPPLTRSTSTSSSSTIVSCITMKESLAIILQIQFILYWIVTWKCTCFDSISILF